jgi:hypothetical protein
MVLELSRTTPNRRSVLNTGEKLMQWVKWRMFTMKNSRIYISEVRVRFIAILFVGANEPDADQLIHYAFDNGLHPEMPITRPSTGDFSNYILQPLSYKYAIIAYADLNNNPALRDSQFNGVVFEVNLDDNFYSLVQTQNNFCQLVTDTNDPAGRIRGLVYRFTRDNGETYITGFDGTFVRNTIIISARVLVNGVVIRTINNQNYQVPTARANRNGYQFSVAQEIFLYTVQVINNFINWRNFVGLAVAWCGAKIRRDPPPPYLSALPSTQAGQGSCGAPLKETVEQFNLQRQRFMAARVSPVVNSLLLN